MILVYGLPGAGKSTLANKLADYYSSYAKQNSITLDIKVIDADDIEQSLKSRTTTAFDPDIWVQSRQIILSSLPTRLHHHQSSSIRHLTIVDDTVLLSGHRRRFRSMANRCKAAYCQILVSVDKSTILKRNEGRRDSNKFIDSDKLTAIIDKIESDACSLIIESECKIDNVAFKVEERLRAFGEVKEVKNEAQERTWVEMLELAARHAVGRLCAVIAESKTDSVKSSGKQASKRVAEMKRPIVEALKAVDRQCIQQKRYADVLSIMHTINDERKQGLPFSDKITEDIEAKLDDKDADINEFIFQLLSALLKT